VEAEGAGAARQRDWARIIRERLAGSQPRHDPSEWLVPGVWGPIDPSQQRFYPRDPVPAAVLMPLVERPELTMLFTQRAPDLRNHAGQISFPGGRIESHDQGSPRVAALREAREEIALEERFVSVIGYLPDHLVISGFRVTPVVAFVQPGFRLSPDPKEVQDTFEVPVNHLFDPANHHRNRRRSAFTGEEVEFCEIPYGERNIWGATAGMLLTLYRLCVEPGAADARRATPQ
jgi:8-oxo-dGTP pyrophosphatase MutT (NUDIX family)